jgi:hypothetical protein
MAFTAAQPLSSRSSASYTSPIPPLAMKRMTLNLSARIALTRKVGRAG